MRKLFFLSLFLFSSLELSARIIKSNKISIVLIETKKYKDKELLVAFDLDETLIVPNNKDHRGGDMWVQARVQNIVDKGIDRETAWDIMAPVYFEIQMDPHFSFKLVEGKETKKVVKSVQKIADKTIGLTARSFPVEDATIKNIEKRGISFKKSGYFKSLSKQNQIFLFHGIPGGFKHGIFFAGSRDKGESLMTLLKACKYKPEVVIFVDDKIKNLKAVEKAVEKADIKFVGILYTRLDKEKAEYALHPDLT